MEKNKKNNESAINVNNTANVAAAGKAEKLTPAMTAAEQAAAAADIIKEYGTLSAVNAVYKVLNDKYGKENYKEIKKYMQHYRHTDIDRAAANVAAAVTYDGQLLAAYDDSRKAADWGKLMKFAAITDIPAAASAADRLAAAADIIRKYYKLVDAGGQPMTAARYVHYDSAQKSGIAILTYQRKEASAKTAAALYLAAIDGIRKAAVNAVYKATDTTATARATIVTAGAIYGAANVTLGRDNDGGAVLNVAAVCGANGKPLSRAAVMSQYAAVNVFVSGGGLSDGWQSWTKDARAAILADMVTPASDTAE